MMSIPLGTVQRVVICTPGYGLQGSCPDGQVQTVIPAYLINPSESILLELMAQPFDSGTAGAYFGLAFASTMFVYLISLAAGSLITVVKNC
jgi:hypothetical protein